MNTDKLRKLLRKYENADDARDILDYKVNVCDKPEYGMELREAERRVEHLRKRLVKEMKKLIKAGGE